MQTRFIVDGPGDAAWHLVLAHGAGAGADTPFMNLYATGLAERGRAAGGIRCLRIEFPYMERARATGRRVPPDSVDVLEAAWKRAIEQVSRELAPGRRLAIGGKSMGGRIATMVADGLHVDAVIVLGYPFHPPGRADRTRTEHLSALATPTLILQGSRDPLGSREEVAGYALSPAVQVQWLPDGDHGFKPRKRSGTTEAANHAIALERITAFLREQEHAERQRRRPGQA